MKTFLVTLFLLIVGAAPASAEYPPVPESTNTVAPVLQPSNVQTLPNTGSNIVDIIGFAALALIVGLAFLYWATRKSD